MQIRGEYFILSEDEKTTEIYVRSSRKRLKLSHSEFAELMKFLGPLFSCLSQDRTPELIRRLGVPA